MLFSQLFYLFGVLFSDMLQYVLLGLFLFLLADELLNQVRKRGLIEKISFHVISNIQESSTISDDLQEE